MESSQYPLSWITRCDPALAITYGIILGFNALVPCALLVDHIVRILFKRETHLPETIQKPPVESQDKLS